MSAAFVIRSFDHGGVLLNLYGTRDEDECTIEIITAADSAIDISDLFTGDQQARLAEVVDAQLAREAKQDNAEARAERANLMRLLAY